MQGITGVPMRSFAELRFRNSADRTPGMGELFEFEFELRPSLKRGGVRVRV